MPVTEMRKQYNFLYDRVMPVAVFLLMIILGAVLVSLVYNILRPMSEVRPIQITGVMKDCKPMDCTPVKEIINTECVSPLVECPSLKCPDVVVPDPVIIEKVVKVYPKSHRQCWEWLREGKYDL